MRLLFPKEATPWRMMETSRRNINKQWAKLLLQNLCISTLREIIEKKRDKEYKIQFLGVVMNTLKTWWTRNFSVIFQIYAVILYTCCCWVVHVYCVRGSYVRWENGVYTESMVHRKHMILTCTCVFILFFQGFSLQNSRHAKEPK